MKIIRKAFARSSYRSRLASAALVAGLCACGGSGGHGASREAVLALSFPPPVSLTSATEITVRGRTEAGRRPSRIFVNGVRARSNDGLAHWQATVALERGQNRIEIEVPVADGNGALRVVKRIQVRSEALANGSGEIFVDGPGDQILVVAGTVTSIDPESGEAEKLFLGEGVTLGLDPAFDEARGLIYYSRALPSRSSAVNVFDVEALEVRGITSFSPAGPTSLAADATGRFLYAFFGTALVEIDLETGAERYAPESQDVSNDCDCSSSLLELHPDGTRAIALGFDNEAQVGILFEVNLETGALGRIAEPMPGSGPALDLGRALALDAAGQQAYALLGGDDPAIVAIDLTTGERRLVSNSARGLGPELGAADSLDVDEERGRIVVSDLPRGVLWVDPASGDREFLVENRVGTGVPLRMPRALVLDARGDAAFVIDSGSAAIVEVAIASGDRRVITSAAVGSGEIIASPIALTLDDSDRRLFVIDESPPRLFSVNRSTGDRSIIASAEVGSGIGLEAPVSVGFDAPRNRLLVVDRELAALVAVDVESGARRLLTSNESFLGPALVAPGSVLVAGASDRAYVIDFPQPRRAAVIEVDLETGMRRALIDPQRDAVGISRLISAVLDIGRNRLLGSAGFDGLFEVNLDTGATAFLEPRPSYGSIEGFAFDPVSETAIYAPWASSELIVLDSRTAERVVLSR